MCKSSIKQKSLYQKVSFFFDFYAKKKFKHCIVFWLTLCQNIVVRRCDQDRFSLLSILFYAGEDIKSENRMYGSAGTEKTSAGDKKVCCLKREIDFFP